MSNEINLLKKTKKGESLAGQKKYARILRIISLTLLCFTVFCSLILFFISLRSPLSELKSQEITEAANLQKQSVLISKYLFIKERIKKLVPIVANRTKLNETIRQIQSYIPDDVSIQNLTLNETNITMTLSSLSLGSLNSVIEAITSRNTQNTTYNKIILDGLTYDITQNEYVLAIKIGLNE